MATVQPTVAVTGNLAIATWAGIVTGDTIKELGGVFAEYTDRCVQIVGTFGGATVTLQGSLDGTNYAGINDQAGAAISMTATGLKKMLELTLWLKPVVTAGSANSITVMVIGKKSPGARG